MSFLVNPFRFAVAVVAFGWNPADKNAGIALSNSDFTATKAAAGQGGVRSVTSTAAGKSHGEFTMTVAVNNERVGIANSSYGLGDLAGYASSVTVAGGQIRSGATVVASLTGGTLTTGETVAFELDGANVYIQRNGQARQGPFTLPGTGPWFLAMSGASGTSITLNTGQAAFVITPTSGYSAWG